MKRLIDRLDKLKIQKLFPGYPPNIDPRDPRYNERHPLRRILKHIEEEIKWWEDMHNMSGGPDPRGLKHNEMYQDLLMHRKDLRQQIETPLT